MCHPYDFASDTPMVRVSIFFRIPYEDSRQKKSEELRSGASSLNWSCETLILSNNQGKCGKYPFYGLR